MRQLVVLVSLVLVLSFIQTVSAASGSGGRGKDKQPRRKPDEEKDRRIRRIEPTAEERRTADEWVKSYITDKFYSGELDHPGASDGRKGKGVPVPRVEYPQPVQYTQSEIDSALEHAQNLDKDRFGSVTPTSFAAGKRTPEEFLKKDYYKPREKFSKRMNSLESFVRSGSGSQSFENDPNHIKPSDFWAQYGHLVNRPEAVPTHDQLSGGSAEPDESQSPVIPTMDHSEFPPPYEFQISSPGTVFTHEQWSGYLPGQYEPQNTGTIDSQELWGQHEDEVPPPETFSSHGQFSGGPAEPDESQSTVIPTIDHSEFPPPYEFHIPSPGTIDAHEQWSGYLPGQYEPQNTGTIDSQELWGQQQDEVHPPETGSSHDLDAGNSAPRPKRKGSKSGKSFKFW